VSLALVFSPQGSQSVGMGRDLADAWPAAAAVFAEADEAVGWPVRELAWEGPAERLNQTQWTQPALLTTSVAALAALEARIDPAAAFVAGHSVGEYAALVAAGVVSFQDALRMVARRGELMARARVEGGMLAVIGLDRSAVDEVIAAVASPADLIVANDNAPGQVVISGTSAALLDAEPPLRQAGARRVIHLPVSGPFHSPWMADASDDLEQVRSPVEWVASVRRMASEGVDTFIECGPGSALTAMVKRIAPESRTLNVSDMATLDTTAAAVRGLPLGTPG
jgi:[acyl-carrier-protein] S-malonyltransferase